MESWHGSKFSKYLTLEIIIEFNGWNVELVAVEVGNREYCSKSVLFCFKNLGFNNTLISRTIKKLEQIFFGMFFLYIAGLKLIIFMFISQNDNAQNLLTFWYPFKNFLQGSRWPSRQTQVEIAVINMAWLRLSPWQWPKVGCVAARGQIKV